MSNRKRSDWYFANEGTICRRTWIERALAGVRGMTAMDEESIEAKKVNRRPKLYVVNSNSSG